MPKTVALCAALLLLAALPARAHHGDADRYNQEVITVTGTVVEVQMVNPHAHIVFDVVEGGKTVRWQAELGGPQQLIKQFNNTTDRPGVSGRAAYNATCLTVRGDSQRMREVHRSGGAEAFAKARANEP